MADDRQVADDPEHERIRADLQAIKARLDGMDKASALLHEDFTRVPTSIDREITHAREFVSVSIKQVVDVFTEKLARVETLFIELDKRTGQLGLANATALTAALQAAEKAVTEQNRSRDQAIQKSEASTAEMLRQLQTQFQTEIRATNTSIGEVKSRLDKGEGGTAGAKESRAEKRLDTSAIVAIVALILLGVSIVAGWLSPFWHPVVH
jgi:hypothetical protein